MDGIAATVAWAGRAPGFVGLDQVNVIIPPGVRTGASVPLVLRSGKHSSNVTAIQTVKNPTSRRAPRWLRQRLSDLRQPLLAAFPAPGRLPLILRPPPACDW